MAGPCLLEEAVSPAAKKRRSQHVEDCILDPKTGRTERRGGREGERGRRRPLGAGLVGERDRERSGDDESVIDTRMEHGSLTQLRRHKMKKDEARRRTRPLTKRRQPEERPRTSKEEEKADVQMHGAKRCTPNKRRSS